MRKTLMTILLLCATASTGWAQKLAVGMNGLGLATFVGKGQWSPTPNAGVEVALWPKWTLDIDAYWNPFKYSDNKSTEFWGVQPEFRYWFCNKFNGHFIGLHGQYADYNDFGTGNYSYTGNFYGGGLSYGYVLPLAYRWKLEFNIGAGYNRVNRDYVWERLPEGTNSHTYGPGHGNLQYAEWIPLHKNYWGITRAGISIVFIIR